MNCTVHNLILARPVNGSQVLAFGDDLAHSLHILHCLMPSLSEREREREEEREGGREREGRREGGKEGGRERESCCI